MSDFSRPTGCSPRFDYLYKIVSKPRGARNKHRNVSDTVSTAVEMSEQPSNGSLSFGASDQSSLRGRIGKLSGVTALRVSYLGQTAVMHDTFWYARRFGEDRQAVARPCWSELKMAKG
jgi:hypothetical protein